MKKEIAEKTIDKFLNAMVIAKENANNEDEFYNNENMNKQYMKLHNIIKRELDDDVLLGSELWENCGSFSGIFYENANNEYIEGTLVTDDSILCELKNTLLRIIDNVGLMNWAGMTLLSNKFSKFPLVSDFEVFKIINPSKINLDKNNLIEEILVNIGINNSEKDKVNKLKESIEWYYEKYRISKESPLMLVELKRGSESGNRTYAKKIINEYSELLRFSIILYPRRKGRILFDDIDNAIMPYNIAMVAPMIIGINKTTYSTGQWSNDLNFINKRECGYLEFNKFMEIWKQYIVPYLKIREKCEENNGIKKSIHNAIAFVSSLRIDDDDDILLKSAIGLEAILSPYKNIGDIKERLAIFSAKLISDDLNNREKIYNLFKKLYNKRCDAVHRGILAKREYFKSPFIKPEMFGFSEDAEDLIGLDDSGMELFIRCYSAMLEWALSEDSGDLKKEDYEKFYERIIIK